MYSAELENKLIVVDIVDTMTSYVSLQPDIDETKVKAAELVAQALDLKKVIGAENLERCINPSVDADDDLRELIIPPLCYYTYARCLKMFQGTFTDSGYVTDGEAEDKNVAKSVSAEMSSIGDTLMEEVITFLEEETPNDENVDKTKLVPRIKVFGGVENRASN